MVQVYLTASARPAPGGCEVPTDSGSASLHKFKSLTIPSPYDRPHTASESQFHQKSPLHLVQSPSPLFLFPPGVFECWYDPREVTSIPSLIGCPWKDVGACRRQIISCFRVRWSGARNTWISVGDHYCQHSSHFFILAATPRLQQLADLHNVCSSAPRALLVIPLSCLPHPPALTQSRGTPTALPSISLRWKTLTTLTQQFRTACGNILFYDLVVCYDCVLSLFI